MQDQFFSRVDRSAFSVGRVGDTGDERAFWWSQTWQQRLEALETLRQIVYGYDPATARLQNVFEVVELAPGGISGDRRLRG